MGNTKSFPDRYVLFPGWGGFKLELTDDRDNTEVKHSDMWRFVGPFASKKPLEGTFRLHITNPKNNWQQKYTVTNISENSEEGVDKEVTLTSNGEDFCTIENPGKLVIKITNENENENLDMWTAQETGTKITWSAGMRGLRGKCTQNCRTEKSTG